MARRSAARTVHIQWLGLAAILLASMVGSTRTQSPEPPASAFDPVGIKPERAYFSQLPFERVDMLNGGLILTFTDLVLPGNAGMDLRFTRTFKNQSGAAGLWKFGISGIPERIGHPTPPDPQEELPYYPIIIMGDGTEYQTLPEGDPWTAHVYHTEHFWRYHTDTRTLELPNGWVATYESGNPPGGVMLVEAHDPFGNAITPQWQEWMGYGSRPFRLVSVTQTVADAAHTSRSRTVSFTYDDPLVPNDPTSMTFEGRTWEYQYDTDPLTGISLLKTVTPPAGQPWSFHYSGGRYGDMTVVTPNGGTVTYDFEDYVVLPYEGTHVSVVSTRTTGGRDVPLGTWSFDYLWAGPGGGYPKRVVHTPDGRHLEFIYQPHMNWRGADWLLEEKVLKLGATEVAHFWRTYGVVRFQTSLVTQEVLQQDGRSFTTEYQYADDTAAGHWGDYHRPWKIISSGHLTKTIEREFDYTFTGYILDKTRVERVTVGGETSATVWEHDDATGFLVQQREHCRADLTDCMTTSFEPDAFGNPRRVVPPHHSGDDPKDTRFTYGWGVVKDTETREYTITRTIDPDGRMTSETRNGYITTFDYDGVGRLEQVTPPVGAATTTTYDNVEQSGRVFTKVSRGPSFTETFLDGFGRAVGTENAVGVKTTVTYDPDGRPTFTSYPFEGTNPTGEDLTYDALGRITRVDRPLPDPVGHPNDPRPTVHYEYFAWGVKVTDEEGHATEQRWSAFGDPSDARLTSVKDAAGSEWFYTYNVYGSLTRVDAPEGPDRTWTYNTRNWLTEEFQPESGTTSYPEHDGRGLVKKKTDARGQTFTYAYDGNDRLTRVDPVGWAHDTTITYDAWDHRTAVDTGEVRTTFAYEAGARLTSRTDVVNGRPFVTTYPDYDDRDNPREIWYPSGTKVRYTYDAANRVTRLADPATNLPYAEGPDGGAIRYHASGALREYRAGNGTTHVVTYDGRARPQHLVSGPLDLTYGYDEVGNVLAIVDGRGAGWGQAFSYDPVDRLTAANGFYGNLWFSYNEVGNRIGSGYTYDGPTQRLTERTAGGVTTTFTYDANGSLTGQQVGGTATTFTYTPDRMVATVTAGGATTSYQYDGDLLRTTKTGSGQTVYTIHDGGGRLLSTFVEQSGTLRWERDDLYLGGQLLAALRPAVGALLLTVTTTGTGAGTVTSVPAGILCGPACAAAFPAGTFVVLTASPAPGARFAGWTGSGGCAAPTADTSRTVFLLEATTCTATFAQVLPLTVTKTGAGSSGLVITSVPPGIVCAGACTVATGAFDAGTEVRLATNTLPAGFAFLGWTGDGCINGPGPGEAQVLMDRERACTATSQLVATKQAPANGTSWLPADVTLSWSGAAPEVGFWVCVDQTNNQVCDTMWWPNGSATAKLFEGLAPGTYYWQVRADTALGLVELDEGAWWSFTVGAPEGATFGKTAPATGTGGLGSAVTLTWAALSGAPGYEVCWDTTVNSTCDGTWHDAGTATSWALTNLAPGSYEWQVRAGGTTDADGGTWWTFAVAVQFGKQAPAHEATWLPTNVWVSWTAVPEAGYWVCVDQTNNNVCDTMWWPNGMATAKLFEGLAPGTYYWQARAQPDGGAMIDADGGLWWRFTVGAPPGTTFTKLAPANGATLTSGTVTFSWSAATGAPAYEVCWDTTPNSTCDGTWQSAGTATTLTVNGLPTGTYTWQVRAGGTTQADGGTWWTVTVPVLRNKLTPANGTTGLTSDVWLSWTAVPNAGYWYCLDTVDNGQCDSMWWPNGGATTMGLGWMGLGPGTYYWQVRSQDDQTGALTDYDGGVWWHFTIGSESEGLMALRGDVGHGGMEAPLPLVPWSPQAAVPTGAIGLSEGERPEADLTLELESPAASSASPGATTSHGMPTGPTEAASGVSTSTASAPVLLLDGEPVVTVEYYHLDALGSVRAVTDPAGVLLRRHDFLPFGEEWQPPVPSGETRLFTGQERDAETGLDYFGARYYRQDLGRFTTIDPVQTTVENLADPQRWNRYVHGRNNPLRFIDPDGRDIWDVIRGMGNAIRSNLAFGVGRESGGNPDFVTGQRVGDLITLAGSAIETATGMTSTGGGVVVCGTGVGCFVGAPAAAGGLVLAGHGVAIGATAGISLMESFGSNPGGTRTASKTLFNKDGVRVDVENPAPDRRPGQVHIQVGREKYIYDPTTRSFKNAPPWIQRLLERKDIQRAIERGLRYLGEE